MLTSAHLTLRPWRTDDEDSLVRYANNHKISRWLFDHFPFPYTKSDAESWIKRANVATPLRSFAVEVDQHAVGAIGLDLGKDVFRRSASLGYWLGEPYWGRGLATEAVKLMTEYGFRNFDLLRIQAGVFEGNPASARVLEKAGFSLEARQQKAVVKDGVILDNLSYVLLH